MQVVSVDNVHIPIDRNQCPRSIGICNLWFSWKISTLNDTEFGGLRSPFLGLSRDVSMLGEDTNPNQNRLLYLEEPTRNRDLKIPKNPPIWEFCNWLTGASFLLLNYQLTGMCQLIILG